MDNKKDPNPISAQIEGAVKELTIFEMMFLNFFRFKTDDVAFTMSAPEMFKKMGEYEKQFTQTLSTAHRNGVEEGNKEVIEVARKWRMQNEHHEDCERMFSVLIGLFSPAKKEKETLTEKQKGFIEGAESMKAKAVREVENYARAYQYEQTIFDILDALNKLTP